MRASMLLLLIVGCGQTNKMEQSGEVTANDVITESQDSVDSSNDELVLENEKVGQRYEYWIASMDPYVTQNEDWTYTFDREGFLASVKDTNPDVYEYFTESSSESSDDTIAIDLLVNGLPVVNAEMAILYTQAGEAAPPPSTYSSTYWWGRQTCYTGSNANSAELALCLGAIPAGFGGFISAAYVGSLCVLSDYLIDNCPTSGFCVKQLWGGFTWVTCP